MYLLFQKGRLKNRSVLTYCQHLPSSFDDISNSFPSISPSHILFNEFGKSFLKFGSQTVHGLCALYLSTCMYTGLQEHFSLHILRIKQPYFQYHATDPCEDNFSAIGTVTALLEANTCNPNFCSCLEDYSGKSH